MQLECSGPTDQTLIAAGRVTWKPRPRPSSTPFNRWLSAIRGGAPPLQLNQNLTEIITIVSSIVAVSKESLPTASRAQGDEILRELVGNCDRLSEMQSQTEAAFTKQTKQAVASASFGVAKVSQHHLPKMGLPCAYHMLSGIESACGPV